METIKQAQCQQVGKSPATSLQLLNNMVDNDLATDQFRLVW
jgi:hypothetical protein